MRRLLRTTSDDREASYERTRQTIRAADSALREHAAVSARSRRAIAEAVERMEHSMRSSRNG